MGKRHALIVAIVASMVVIGCGAASGEGAPVEEAIAEQTAYEGYVSDQLVTDYEGALPASSQLALGSLLLAETDDTITPEQANVLLPLWQALRGGVTASQEVNAVLQQVESALRSEQVAAITAMQLTQEDMAAWMQERGIRAGAGGPGGQGGGELSEDERATRQAEFGGRQGGGGELPPDMATRRAELEDMSEEEREALRATVQAGGSPFGEGEPPAGRGAGGPIAGGRGYFVMLGPLIDMLETLAADQ